MPTLGQMGRKPSPAFLSDMDRVLASMQPRTLAQMVGAPAPSSNGAPPAPVTLGQLIASPQAASPAPAAPTPSPEADAAPLTLDDLRLDWPAGEKRKPNKTLRTLGDIAGVVGDALMAYGGMAPQFAPQLAREHLAEQQAGFDREKLNLELEAKRQDALRPRMEQVGNTIGILDPAAQRYTPTFTAPGPAEQYASALGYQPGTDEFKSAVQDYRLGSWSDPAMDNRLTLEGVRFGNRRTLQNDRLAVTRRGQDLTHTDRQAAIGQSNTNNLRSTGTSRENNIRSTETSNANNMRSNATRMRTARHVGSGPVQVNTPEEARALPKGTLFMTPDGRVKQR